MVNPEGARVLHQPMRSDDGGVGYNHLPRSRKDFKTDSLRFGNIEVTVEDHWVGYGELETVQEALGGFLPENLQGLKVEFVNHRLVQKRTGRAANAQYHRVETKAVLSRAGARDYSILRKDDANHALAVDTIRHEEAHHVWDRQTNEFQEEWLRAFVKDGGRLQGDVLEVFANEVAKFSRSPELYLGANVAEFFRGSL